MSSMTYNIAGQLTGDTLTSSGSYNGTLINSSTAETFGYDTYRMQLISQTAVTTNTNGVFCVPPPCPPPPPGGTNLSLNYSYQASAGQMGVGTTAGNTGQLMSISGTIGGLTESANYTYDNYGRLATASQTSNGSSTNRRFYYDRWGNRTTTYQYLTQIQSINLQTVSFPGTGVAPTNRVTSVTSGSTLNYTYDANGNVTNDGLHSYTYDSENRVIKVDGGAAIYAYDHQNRRYKKSVGSSVTHYVWEGSQVVGEYNGSTGTVLVTYSYAGSRLIGKTGGSTQVFLSDRLSVRLALTDVGVVAGRQGHLPFGEDFGESGTQDKHHFTSYERDSESATDYAVNRRHSKDLGRFMSRDPEEGSLVNPQALNLYSYVHNNPTNDTDPLGLITVEQRDGMFGDESETANSPGEGGGLRTPTAAYGADAVLENDGRANNLNVASSGRTGKTTVYLSVRARIDRLSPVLTMPVWFFGYEVAWLSKPPGLAPTPGNLYPPTMIFVVYKVWRFAVYNKPIRVNTWGYSVWQHCAAGPLIAGTPCYLLEHTSGYLSQWVSWTFR